MLETFIALDLSGAGSIIQTDSDTYCKLKVGYTISDWTFGSLSTFGVGGLHTQEFLGFGSLGLIVLDTRLLFSPIGGRGPGLVSDSKSVAGVEHRYDLGTTCFVDWVSVVSITVVPTGAQWRIKTSIDGATWDWSSQVFTGSVPSGQVSVGGLARYVTIYAVTGGAYIQESDVTISISSESWTTTGILVDWGVTLTGTLTIATSGSSFSIKISGTSAGNKPVSGTLYFNAPRPGCSFRFSRFAGTFGFSFGCLENATATLAIRCPETDGESAFEELAFSTGGIDLGLPNITFNARLAFSLTEKSVTLTPVLNLGDTTCFTLYTSLVAGPAGAIAIEGLSMYGIQLLWSLNGVEFESLTYLDGIHHTKEDYWEMFRISVDGDTCCGGAFDFEVTTHFGDTHTSLFDWAETEFEAEFGLGASYVFSTYLSFTSAGVNDLIFGFVFSW